MRVLIVHAHHEPQSFNGALTRTAVAAMVGDVNLWMASGQEHVVIEPSCDLE